MSVAQKRPAISWYRRDRASAGFKQRPQRVDALSPRKPTRAPDNRDMGIVKCENAAQGLCPQIQRGPTRNGVSRERALLGIGNE